MGTNCAPLLLMCFYFAMGEKSFSKEKRDDMNDAFNSTSRHLDDLLNIDNILFDYWFTGYIQLSFN